MSIDNLYESVWSEVTVRHVAGEWLRRRIRMRHAKHGVLLTLTFGYVVGAGISLWLVPILGGEPWMVLLIGAALICMLVIALARDKDLDDGNLPIRDMEKGANAEEAVGQMIEFVLMRDGCAVAHNVEGIARYGDIDHLVATPLGLWVIETKSARIPATDFARTLRQIKANIEEVQRWAPDVQVTGCIVFGGSKKVPSKRSYSVDGVSIRCYSKARELVLQLREEARSNAGSSSIAKKVWNLANVEETA